MYKRYKKQQTYSWQTLAIFLLAILLFSNCNNSKNDSHNLEPYFYPQKDLESGKVYVYTPVNNDSLASYMWYYKINYGYLSGTKYDSKFRVEQTTTEEFVKGGITMNQLILCEYASDTAQKCIPRAVNVEYDDTFPYNVTDDSSALYLYKVNWESAIDTGVQVTVTKNRHFLGFTTYTYQDKTYDCAKFGIRETALVGNNIIGYQTIPSYTEELYAKDLGLIYTKKNIDNAIIQEYELADRITMEELEALVKTK